MISDLLLWTCVVGGTPLALALIRQAGGVVAAVGPHGEGRGGCSGWGCPRAGPDRQEVHEEDEHNAIVRGEPTVALRSTRSDRPKRRTVALRASVGSTESNRINRLRCRRTNGTSLSVTVYAIGV